MDEPKSYLRGRYSRRKGVVRDNALNQGYDYGLGKRERGSRWQRNVHWEDPASGIKFYELGQRAYAPFTYMVIGVIGLAFALSFTVLSLAHHYPIRTTVFISVLSFGIAGSILRMGFNLKLYDRLHGYRYASKRMILRYQADVAGGSTPSGALSAMARYQVRVTLIGAAGLIPIGALYWGSKYGY